MWYHFNQNNSGGDFVFNKDRGITHHVLIEAKSAKEANNRAERIGLYFNGCDDGIDCDCCGDRWYSMYEDNLGTAKPTISGEPVAKYKALWLWMKPNPEAVKHPLKGKFKWIELKEEKR